MLAGVSPHLPATRRATVQSCPRRRLARCLCSAAPLNPGQNRIYRLLDGSKRQLPTLVRWTDGCVAAPVISRELVCLHFAALSRCSPSSVRPTSHRGLSGPG